MIDAAFGNWLAGFIDGEGCFYITTNTNQPGWCRPKFALGLRCDDRPVVESIRTTLGDIGTIHEYQPKSNSKRKVHWTISSQADCEALCVLLDAHPLRSKKQKDYEFWSRAVSAAAKLRRGNGVEKANADIYAFIKKCRNEIARVRVYE